MLRFNAGILGKDLARQMGISAPRLSVLERQRAMQAETEERALRSLIVLKAEKGQ